MSAIELNLNRMKVVLPDYEKRRYVTVIGRADFHSFDPDGTGQTDQVKQDAEKTLKHTAVLLAVFSRF